MHHSTTVQEFIMQMFPLSRQRHSTLLIFCTVFLALPAVLCCGGWSRGGPLPYSPLQLHYSSGGDTVLALVQRTFTSEYALIRHAVSTGTWTMQDLPLFSTWSKVFVSRDGTALASLWKLTDSVAIWSIPENRLRALLPVSANRLEKAVFTDGNRTVVCMVRSTDNTMRIERWDVQTGMPLRSFPLTSRYAGSNQTLSFNLSDDGETVWSVTTDFRTNTTYLEFLYTRTGEYIVHTVEPHTTVLDVAGEFYISRSSVSKPLSVRSIAGNFLLTQIDTQLFQVGFTHGGRYILAKAIELPDKQAIRCTLYDSYTGNIRLSTVYRRITHYHDVRPMPCAVSPDLSTLVDSHYSSYQCDGGSFPLSTTALGVYRTSSGEPVTAYPSDRHFKAIDHIALSRTHVASSDADSQTLIRTLDSGTFTGGIPGRGTLVFTPDGSTVLRASDSTIEIIDIAAATIADSIPTALPDIREFRWSPDSTRLLTLSAPGIAVYAYPGLAPLFVRRYASATTAAAGWTRNGDIVVLLRDTSHPTDLLVHTWSVNGALLSEHILHDTAQPWSQILLAPTADVVIAGKQVRSLAPADNGSILHTLPFVPAAFMPDGATVIVPETIGSIYSGVSTIFRIASVAGPTIDRYLDGVSAGEILAGAAHLVVDPSGSTAVYTYTSPSACNLGVLTASSLVERNDPLLQCSPCSIDFGVVRTGEQIDTTITLHSIVKTPSVVHGIAGPTFLPPGTVSVQYGRPLPDTLRYHQEQRTINVRFSPLHTGVDTFSIPVYVGGYTLSDTLRIAMRATVVGPRISTWTEAVDFGNVPIGNWKTDTVVVQNGPQASLYIASAFIDDPMHSNQVSHLVAGLLPRLIPPGGSLSVAVTYLPTGTESLNARLVLATNDPDRPQIRIPLHGRGVGAVGIHEQPALVQTVLRILPNPASQTAQALFDTRTPGAVRLELFATDGRHIATVFDGWKHAGAHALPLPLEHLPAGVYYCRLSLPAGVLTRPVVVAP